MKVKYTSEDNVDQIICHVLKKKKHKKVFYSSICLLKTNRIDFHCYKTPVISGLIIDVELCTTLLKMHKDVW